MGTKMHWQDKEKQSAINYQSVAQYDHGSSGNQLESCSSEPEGDGEIPLEDPSAIQNLMDEQLWPPSAPPLEEMDPIPGYDDILSPTVSFVAPPPTYQEATTGKLMEDFQRNRDQPTEEEARQLLVAHARSHCCWNKAAAEGMWFKSTQPSTAVHYVLKTFLETRATDWASEPFRGQGVDGRSNGTPPTPWEIQVSTPEMFHDCVLRTEVPHTASVRSCYNCHGAGRIRCTGCSGWGRNRCYSCQGAGETGLQESRNRCISCEGSGHRRCTRCYGRGRLPCPVCDSTGRLKCFIRLTVSFATHTKDFILEQTPLPNYLIREVPGTTLFEDTQPLLNPIQGFPEQQVNSQSASIIHEHRALAQTGRIWMQNHVIRGVPVFQCDCAWKDKEFQFFVFGDNRQVHCSDYPQTCCCCRCQLL